jgi:hypothetical protein
MEKYDCRWTDNGCSVTGATWLWINGLKSFLDMTESHRTSKAVHAALVEITRNSLNEALYTSTLLKVVSWITILFGPSMVNLEF